MKHSAILLLMVISLASGSEYVNSYKKGFYHLISTWAQPLLTMETPAPLVKELMADKMAILLTKGYTLNDLVDKGYSNEDIKCKAIPVEGLALGIPDNYKPKLNKDSIAALKALPLDKALLKFKEAMFTCENSVKQILRENPISQSQSLDASTKKWLEEDVDLTFGQVREFKTHIDRSLEYILMLLLATDKTDKQYTVLKHRYYENLSATMDHYYNQILQSEELDVEEVKVYDEEMRILKEQRDQQEKEERIRLEQEAALKEQEKKEKKEKKPVTGKTTTTKKPSTVGKKTTLKPLAKAAASKKDSLNSSPTLSTDSESQKSEEEIEVEDPRHQQHNDRIKEIERKMQADASVMLFEPRRCLSHTPNDPVGEAIVNEIVALLTKFDSKALLKVKNELETLRKEVSAIEALQFPEPVEGKVNLLI